MWKTIYVAKLLFAAAVACIKVETKTSALPIHEYDRKDIYKSYGNGS